MWWEVTIIQSLFYQVRDQEGISPMTQGDVGDVSSPVALHRRERQTAMLQEQV